MPNSLLAIVGKGLNQFRMSPRGNSYSPMHFLFQTQQNPHEPHEISTLRGYARPYPELVIKGSFAVQHRGVSQDACGPGGFPLDSALGDRRSDALPGSDADRVRDLGDQDRAIVARSVGAGRS
jgi:hypothetical protein